MAAADNHIKRVSDKLQLLLKQYQLLQKENGRLKAQLQQLDAHHTAQSLEVELLQQQAGILKAAAGQMNDADKKVFEKKINQYIKDIDKCITLLSE